MIRDIFVKTGNTVILCRYIRIKIIKTNQINHIATYTHYSKVDVKKRKKKKKEKKKKPRETDHRSSWDFVDPYLRGKTTVSQYSPFLTLKKLRKCDKKKEKGKEN